MQTIDVRTVWYTVDTLATLVSFSVSSFPPHYNFGYLKIPTFESQRASVASILCLLSSYQELEIK